ncbi:MAG: glycosyltransferase [Prevotellaceae bacterium]|jgi:glycosyltransferase involved in cell wall biosynthesis|nr:glycosyltransferase [Prevotellaceae bacterium]
MEKSIKISVIVPVFNAEKWIAQCIEMLMCQTFSNLEIIVVDDGSTDGSAEIVAQFPVRFIKFEQNKGLSAARNAGIDYATGNYIHFFDVDDLINLEFYEKMADAVLLTAADIACCGVEHEPKPKISYRFAHRLLVSTVEDKMKLTNVCNEGFVWRFLFKTEFLKTQNLRFEEGRLIEDLTFLLQSAYYAKRIITVPDAVYYYKLRQNSILTTIDKFKKRKLSEDWQHAHNFCIAFAKEHNFSLK